MVSSDLQGGTLMLKFLIDADTGIDDSIAILYEIGRAHV